MKRFLALISALLFLSPVFCSAQGRQPSDSLDSDIIDSWEYQLLINARGNDVTGLCLMNVLQDSTIVGTIVNEFGAKIFDFTYSKGKTKIMNVIGPINKWYIRRVLKKDFSFILPNLRQSHDVIEKKRKLTVQPNGDVSVSNDKYKIYYVFTKMQEEL